MSRIKNYLNDMFTKKVSEKEFSETLKTLMINHKRLEVFRAFVIKLNSIIHETYLGREYINSPEDIRGHFNWCFSACCELFKLINIDFSDNEEIFDHFFEYFTFYIYENEKQLKEKEINVFFSHILSLSGDKYLFEVNEFIDLYNKFNKSMKNVKTKII